MAFKPIRFIPDDTKIPFLLLSRFGFFFSGLVSLASVLLFLFIGLNVGVDFKGGTVITVRTEQAANIDQLRTTLDGLGFGSIELQEFGTPNDLMIRVGAQDGGDAAQQAVVDKIKTALGPGIEYRSVDVVGPKVSSELAEQGNQFAVNAPAQAFHIHGVNQKFRAVLGKLFQRRGVHFQLSEFLPAVGDDKIFSSEFPAA